LKATVEDYIKMQRLSGRLRLQNKQKLQVNHEQFEAAVSSKPKAEPSSKVTIV
jgi:hypothetical protein